MIRILHIADIHLGRRFDRFGEFGRTLRGQVRQTLVDLLRAAGNEYQLVLLAGDVFDANRPDIKEVRTLLEAVRAIDPVPVCLLPGTHDRLSADSVYRRPEVWKQRPASLHIFSEEQGCFYFERLRLAVHGRAARPDFGGQSPLVGIQPHPDARFNIAVAHSSIPLAQAQAEDGEDYCLRAEDAAASRMTYIALGHWHRFQDCFPGNQPPVFYAGCPEPVAFDGTETAGSYARVTISESGVEVAPQTSGKYRWRDLELDVTGQEDDIAIRHALGEAAGSEYVVRLTLRGQPAGQWQPASAVLEEELGGSFAYLAIRDETTRQVDIAQLRGQFVPNSVGDFFCRAVEEKLQSATPEPLRHWREVLRRGAALLLHKEEVGE